jgi:hypothetical protein
MCSVECHASCVQRMMRCLFGGMSFVVEGMCVTVEMHLCIDDYIKDGPKSACTEICMHMTRTTHRVSVLLCKPHLPCCG